MRTTGHQMASVNFKSYSAVLSVQLLLTSTYKDCVYLWARHMNGWQCWRQDLNCVLTGRPEETNWSSSDYLDHPSPTISDYWSSQHGSEPATTENAGYKWRYTLLWCARNDDDDDDDEVLRTYWS